MKPNRTTFPWTIVPSATDPELEPGPLCYHSKPGPSKLWNNRDTGLRSEEAGEGGVLRAALHVLTLALLTFVWVVLCAGAILDTVGVWSSLPGAPPTQCQEHPPVRQVLMSPDNTQCSLEVGQDHPWLEPLPYRTGSLPTCLPPPLLYICSRSAHRLGGRPRIPG